MDNRPHDGDQQQFDPGPSFTDVDAEDAQMGEMPSWLQSFAETVSDEGEEQDSGEQTAGAQAGSASVADEEPPTVAGLDVDEVEIPGWLSAPRDLPGASDGADSVGAAFFSEDDLPDWLRALNAEPEAESSTPSSYSNGVMEQPRAAAAPQALAVPAVTNVWVTGMEERVENPGASLFATIAAGGEVRPELVGMSTTRASQTLAAPAQTTQQDAQPAGERRRTSWTRRERALLVAVIVMTIVLLFLLNSNYGG